jgi:hypothetical protein
MPVLFKALTILLVQFGRSYRPELHYMRGPGPKWHAKNNLAFTTTASSNDRDFTHRTAE